MSNALVVRNLSKSFGGVPALGPIDLSIPTGQVHALVGQNGCGKSTFVKCLTGYHRPDSGEVAVFGRELSLPVHSPGEHGIAVIHQDVGLVPNMTVLENLGANAGYGARLLGSVRVREEREIYRALFDRLGVSVPLDVLVADLSPAEHALVGIVRAMRLMSGEHEQHLFILDEPTAYLNRAEAVRVTTFMRRVADLGSSVIFISHRLGEVLEYCDAVTVLRDGQLVSSVSTDGLSRSELVAQMLGRRLQDFYPSPVPVAEAAEPRLVVDGVAGDIVDDFSLEVRAGEIVGVTGLAGMGQEELPHLLAGSKKAARGTVSVAGVGDVTGNIPRAIDAGLVMIPGNRHRDGCWLDATAAENVTLASLDRFRGRGRLVSWRRERITATRLLEQSGVRPLAPRAQMRNFSGGNQQKIVFGKWLFREPDVLLLDEPTQGVDAGAGRELLDQVASLAEQGTAVVVFSGDHEQIAAICHRVLVLHHGRVIAELSGEGLDEATLLEACEDGATTPAVS